MVHDSPSILNIAEVMLCDRLASQIEDQGKTSLTPSLSGMELTSLFQDTVAGFEKHIDSLATKCKNTLWMLQEECEMRDDWISYVIEYTPIEFDYLAEQIYDDQWRDIRTHII